MSLDSCIIGRFKKILDDLDTADYYGLSSPGLTCYLNSVLQVLFMTKDFRKALRRSCKSSTFDVRLSELFTDLEQMRSRTHNIIKELGIKDVYEQRDAGEYLEKILCLTNPEASKIFKGELNQRITCSGCKDKNDSRSFFWILPLAIEDLHHKAYDVEEGLRAFFQVQKVCDDNQMYCNKCHKKQDADIKWEITHNPDVLTLLLKRFSFDSVRKCYVKLHCRATVPKILNMEKCVYDLYAVVNHYGTLTGGHYTAEIQSFETEWWYCFNDDVVKSAKPQLFGSGKDSMRSSTAYLLMYRKVNEELEQTEGNDHEDQSAKSHMEEEDGEFFLPYHPLQYEGCRGGEDVKHLNGDLLEKPLYGEKNYKNYNWDLEEATKGTNYTNTKDEMHQLNPRCSPNPQSLRFGAPQRREVEQQHTNSFKQEGKTVRLNARKTLKKCDKVTKKPWR